MDTNSNHPDIEQLLIFQPLQALDQKQLVELARTINIESVDAGTTIMQRGSNDDYTLLLLEGELELTAADGKKNHISAGDPSAINPIARLRPRRYEVRAQTNIRILRIDNVLLLDVPTPTDTGYEVSGDATEDATEYENELTSRFLKDLENDEVTLPSLPEVAMRIGQAVNDELNDAEHIAALIQSDPVITAKLIKAANSALYGSHTPVESCVGAVVRLGNDLTHKLVLTYTLRDLFKSRSILLQKRMKALWKHSTHVAAICSVLAEITKRFDPEHAMLAGLMHDIGIVAVLNYIEGYHSEELQPATVDHAIDSLRAQTGGMILRKWGFATDFIVTALEAEEWMRNKGHKPDYCDLVVVAQLHSLVGTDRAHSLPAIDQIPALKRLKLGGLTPKMSLEILEQAEDRITQKEALLNF
ncbi:MAG: HDOD domain-containing protein [Candidatus Sedimenticola sp. (ex Thyasira tokunagai)]